MSRSALLRAWPGVLFAGLLVLFLADLYVRGSDLDPTARDQVSDLSLAIRIREGGELSDGNRHPLLPALLAGIARRDPAFFVDARIVALLLAGLCAATIFAAGTRVFGRGPGLVAALAFLPELRFQARRVCPEPLTALFLLLGAFALAHLESSRRPLRTAAFAGLALGVAWLAKGTALLALLAALVWILWRLGRRAAGPAGSVVLGFVLAASPLLVSNAVHHGWPLRDVNADHVMWEDHWDQNLDQTSSATFSSYVRAHALSDAGTRLGRGLVRQKAVEWVYGFLLLALVAGLVRRRRSASRSLLARRARRPAGAWTSYALLSAVVWLLPMAWYWPIARSRRFLFPVVALLLPAALGLLAGLAPRRARGRARSLLRRPVVPRLALGTGALAATLALVLVLAHGDPRRERHVDDASLGLVGELEAPAFAGSRVLAKPSRTLPPDWLLEGQVTFLAIPAAVDAARAPGWIAARADHVLLSPGLLAQRPDLFAGAAAWDERRGIVLEAPPPWLVPVWRDEGTPCRYVLLRVVRRGG